MIAVKKGAEMTLHKELRFSIPERLHRLLKLRAVAERTTLKRFLEEALRAALKREPSDRASPEAPDG